MKDAPASQVESGSRTARLLSFHATRPDYQNAVDHHQLTTDTTPQQQRFTRCRFIFGNSQRRQC